MEIEGEGAAAREGAGAGAGVAAAAPAAPAEARGAYVEREKFLMKQAREKEGYKQGVNAAARPLAWPLVLVRFGSPAALTYPPSACFASPTGWSALYWPAFAQEEEGLLQFRCVCNDGLPSHMMDLIALKNIFSKQLPNVSPRARVSRSCPLPPPPLAAAAPPPCGFFLSFPHARTRAALRCATRM